MIGRSGHYMPPSLLASQLATLEPPQPDEHALTLDITQPVPQLLQRALAWLGGSDAA
jgi:gluconokinase